jgi:hypothetical protein
LRKRLLDLEQERQLSAAVPLVVGAVLVVPMGLLLRLTGHRQIEPTLFAKETRRVELAAMAAVMDAERALGHESKDVSAQKCGYDIESRVLETGRLRFIEVKGRIEGAETVTVTKNEVIAALNKPQDFLLALVLVPESTGLLVEHGSKVRELGGVYDSGEQSQCQVRYVLEPFRKEPDFGACSINYDLKELWERGVIP